MKTRTSVGLLNVLLMPLIAIRHLAQSANAEIWHNLTRDLHQLRKECALPGMSVSVIVDQHVVYTEGFGLADTQKKVPATETTPYHICSLTKPFSAILVMRLVEAGRISLDSRMRDLCAESEFMVNGEPVQGYERLGEKLVGLINHPCSEHDFTVRQHLSHTARGVPGAKFRYTGWLFAMLTEAIEAVTNQDFTELLINGITGPLGLSMRFRAFHRRYGHRLEWSPPC